MNLKQLIETGLQTFLQVCYGVACDTCGTPVVLHIYQADDLVISMPLTPIHLESDTRTPGLEHPCTWTWTPAHPDSDTHTPGLGHLYNPDLDTRTLGLGHPYTWNRTPANPDWFFMYHRYQCGLISAGFPNIVRE